MVFEGWLFTDTGRRTPICIAEQSRDKVIFTPDAEALIAAIRTAELDVFTLDPFIKTHDVSENDNRAIDRVVQNYATIAEATNCAIELVHHVRKGAANGRAELTAEDARGASAAAAPVSGLNLQPAGAASKVSLAWEKPVEPGQSHWAIQASRTMAPFGFRRRRVKPRACSSPPTAVLGSS